VSTASYARVPSLDLVPRSTHRQFNQLFEEAARLAEADLPPDKFYAALIQGIANGTQAVGGAVWSRTAEGSLYLESQINLPEAFANRASPMRQQHEALLVQALQAGGPAIVPGAPRPPLGAAGNSASPGVPFATLFAPIMVATQVHGLLELWKEPPAADPQALPLLLQFLTGIAHHASIYVRNRQLRTFAGQRRVWEQVETFCRQLHASLDLREVSYIIANEGKPLVECDRLSVVTGRAARPVVQAISGVDVIEKRSNEVRRLLQLSGRVLAWGEKLVYRGAADSTLPGDVAQALDAYLEVRASKLLVVLPLRDDEDDNGRARFALVAESFDPALEVNHIVARLDVLGKHAQTALANAALYHGVPLRWLWRLWGRLFDRRAPVGAGWSIGIVAVAAIIAALVLIAAPWKMEAVGQLLPRERRWLYPTAEGQVVRFEQGVQPGATVVENQALALMYDMQLELRLHQLANDLAGIDEEIAALALQQNNARTEPERSAYAADKKQKELVRSRRAAELKALREQTHSDESRPGYFWLTAPLNGTVLNGDFREKLTNRFVQPSEPLLRIGDKTRGWEIELRIPYKHMGPILDAFAASPKAAELDVDLLLQSAPTRTFRGKLCRPQLAGEASADHNGAAEGPVVRAWVRIDGADIPADRRISPDLLLTGTEIRAKVCCGQASLGYVLFYGVWEFVYEKLFF
jgi:hypothetical protein